MFAGRMAMGKYELPCILLRSGFARVHSLLHYLPFVIEKKTNKNAKKKRKKNPLGFVLFFAIISESTCTELKQLWYN